MKSNGLPGVVYDLSGSDSGPVRPMLTVRAPKSPEQGLGRNAGKDVDVKLLPRPFDTSSGAMPESSTVACARAAVRMKIIMQIICLFMRTPLNICLKKRKKL
jgi:hypothetical protein